MHPGTKLLLGAALIAPSFMFAITNPKASYGDEPSRLSRLFRFGGGGAGSASSAPNAPAPATPSPRLPMPAEQPPAAVFSNNSTGSQGASPRLIPQPRVSQATTEADPILSRISLVRSSDGNQFGMCMQIYADGTVLDNEGTHHLKPSDLKPLTDLLESGDLYRLKGHCGAPATDFVEQVHMVVYERSLGRLRANAFSYSGNPQGCDHAVRHLHTALEAIQAKLSRSAPPVPTTASAPAPAPIPSGTLETPSVSGPTISLSPSN